VLQINGLFGLFQSSGLTTFWRGWWADANQILFDHAH